MNDQTSLAIGMEGSRIFVVQNHHVMLDADLAALYEVATKVLLQAVRRNQERFPLDFCFALKEHDVANLRSQIVTSSWGGRRSPPVAFTEQGVAMLSSVLKSPRAIQVNIEIMRAFVNMRKSIFVNSDLGHRLNALESRYDRQFKIVFDAIRKLMAEPVPTTRPIGFDTNRSER